MRASKSLWQCVLRLKRSWPIQEPELLTGNLCRKIKTLLPLVVVLATSSLVSPGTRAHAQLHWPDPPKKKPLRLRMVAVAFSYPRSSFFASHEVLIAEQELAQD